ncbi:hypothetical protein [Desulfosporosinus fructosivorans]
MKTNGKCTKCNSNDIVKIPGRAGAYASGNNIMTGMTTFSAVLVTRYLCCSCGYSEEWIDNKRDIEKIRAKY